MAIEPPAPAELRRLGPGDLALLRAVLAVMAEAFEDEGRSALPDDAHLHRVLADPRVVVLVASISGEVVGGLTGHVLPKLNAARQEFYLYDLAVAAPHRRRGVARALIREAWAVVQALGVDAIYVQADVEDGPAIALYTRLGEASEVLHFDLRPPARAG